MTINDIKVGKKFDEYDDRELALIAKDDPMTKTIAEKVSEYMADRGYVPFVWGGPLSTNKYENMLYGYGWQEYDEKEERRNRKRKMRIKERKMKRSEAKLEYTWDFSHIFENDLAWEKAYAYNENRLSEFAKYRGKLSFPELTLKLFKFSDEVEAEIEKIYVYANMKMHTDGANADAVSLAARAEKLSAEYSAVTSFVQPELCALPDETLQAMIDSEDFADYDYILKRIMSNKPHVLTDKEEYVLARLSEVTHGYKDVFEKIDSVDLPHPEIRVGEERIPLTHGTYSKLLQNPDAQVRRKAFKTFYSLYEHRINTIATCYSNNVKRNNIVSSMRGYEDALDASISGDDVPKGVYKKLVENVDDNLPVLHDYIQTRSDIFGGNFHMYDMYVPLVEGVNLSMDYEKAFDLVLDALAPLGEEYVGELRKMKKERRIDVMENEGKRGGAYSWGAYGTGPYVLLNYAGTTHDIFTIAHELGHAMHSLYSDRALPMSKAGYSIFVAEVASTTNEVLLLKYLLKTTTDRAVKKYLLSYYLDTFRTTLFRQTMFAEFEASAHASEKKGEPLTVDSLNKEYLKLNKKYYGKSVTHDKEIRFEWARIPHFYTAFYVYKYATGLTSAVTLACNILKGGEAKTKYFENFLKAGGKKSPYEILVDAGVDLMTDEPYEVAMREFKETLQAFKTL